MAAMVVAFASGKPWSARQHPRKGTTLLGFLDTVRRDAPIACVVKDLSLGGAKVVPSSSVALKHVRFLAVPHCAFEMLVRLVWENTPECGPAPWSRPGALWGL